MYIGFLEFIGSAFSSNQTSASVKSQLGGVFTYRLLELRCGFAVLWVYDIVLSFVE